LTDIISSAFSPFIKVLSPLASLYQHYQSKGQGPIFVFSLVGIALLVGGFGYLTQLLVGKLGAGSRSLLLLFVSNGVVFGGHKLASKNRLADLGSATIGLGLLLNFVTVYIAGSYYHLLTDWLVIFAYIAIGVGGFALSNRHDARVVSAISLVGAGFVPLILPLDQSGSIFYLSGLGLLTLGSVYQAQQKSWMWLYFLSVFVCSASLEYMQVFSDIGLIIGLFAELFYIIYLWLSYHLFAIQAQTNKTSLGFLTLAVFSTIGLLCQTTFPDSWMLPVFALGNCLAAILVWQRLHLDSPLARTIMLMVASIWLLVAIFSSLQADYWGIAVGLEGLFVLYVALKLGDKTLRFEAYALWIFAIVHGLTALAPHFPIPALVNPKGLLLVVSIGAFLFVARMLLQTNARQNISRFVRWEQNITMQLRAAESLWLSITVIAFAWAHLTQWSLLVFAPLQGYLLYRSHRQYCQTSETLVLILGSVLALTAVLTAITLQSWSFRDLPSYAQYAFTVFFIELWALCEFYRFKQRNDAFAKLAEELRLLAYLALPFAYLPSVTKHYSEYLPLALWLSAAIAYVLARTVKHPLLRTEALLLTIVAAVFNSAYMVDPPKLLSLIGLASCIIGIALNVYIWMLVGLRHPLLLDKKIASVGLYYLFALFFIVVWHTSNVYLASALSGIVTFCLVGLHHFHPNLQRNNPTLQLIGYINVVMACLLTAAISANYQVSAASVSTSLWLLSTSVLLGYMLFADSRDNQPLLGLIKASQTRYATHNLMLASSLYFLLDLWHLSMLITPWLIVQGSYVFFARQQSTIISKLALAFMLAGLLKLGFIDAANALLWQKVALMIGIGGFMLVAAFVYQKRLNNAS